MCEIDTVEIINELYIVQYMALMMKIETKKELVCDQNIQRKIILSFAWLCHFKTEDALLNTRLRAIMA